MDMLCASHLDQLGFEQGWCLQIQMIILLLVYSKWQAKVEETHSDELSAHAYAPVAWDMDFVAAELDDNLVAVVGNDHQSEQTENLVDVTDNNQWNVVSGSLVAVGDRKKWPDHRMAAAEHHDDAIHVNHLEAVHLEPMDDNLPQRLLILLLMPSLVNQHKKPGEKNNFLITLNMLGCRLLCPSLV